MIWFLLRAEKYEIDFVGVNIWHPNVKLKVDVTWPCGLSNYVVDTSVKHFQEPISVAIDTVVCRVQSIETQ